MVGKEQWVDLSMPAVPTSQISCFWGNQMTKRKLIMLTVLVVGMMFALATSAAAGPPTAAEGLWRYQPAILEMETRGCNTFLTTSEDGVWTGTFDGVSTEDGRVVIHCNGRWSFHAIANFSAVAVDGREGTLVMSVNGSRPDEEADWTGRWVILSGTGELENLRGQGTWWGPGAPGPGEWGDIYYAGKVHFEPN